MAKTYSFVSFSLSCRRLRLLIATVATCGMFNSILSKSSPSAAAAAAAAVAAQHQTMSSSSSCIGSRTKRLWILRHGQAQHNPRAEKAREEGCSYDTFIDLMRQDDALDADLTELGKQQAQDVSLLPEMKKLKEHVQLVVSSPLSRALRTADLALPPYHHQADDDKKSNEKNNFFSHKRVCLDNFREINGYLLNAKRRNRSELEIKFPNWCFKDLPTETDELWTPELEEQNECGKRGYQGLCWIADRPEESIFLVCHGGILRFTMQGHPHVRMVDGRSKKSQQKQHDNEEEEDDSSIQRQFKDVTSRFGNCELRQYIMTWKDITTTDPNEDHNENKITAPNDKMNNTQRYIIELKQVD